MTIGRDDLVALATFPPEAACARLGAPADGLGAVETAARLAPLSSSVRVDELGQRRAHLGETVFQVVADERNSGDIARGSLGTDVARRLPGVLPLIQGEVTAA